MSFPVRGWVTSRANLGLVICRLAISWSCMVVSLFSDSFPSAASEYYRSETGPRTDRTLSTVVRDVKRALMMISLPVSEPSLRRPHKPKLIFCPFSLQLAFVISSIYWPLMLFFPHLIMRSMDEQPLPGALPQLMRLPLATDLALHALPLFTLLIDFFVFQPKFSKIHVHKVAPIALVVFTVWYVSFVEYCAAFNGSCESLIVRTTQRPHTGRA